MSKLLLFFLFFFIALAMGDVSEESSDVIADSKQNLELASVLVKREAGKTSKKGKNAKTETGKKANKGKRNKGKGRNTKKGRGKNEKKAKTRSAKKRINNKKAKNGQKVKKGKRRNAQKEKRRKWGKRRNTKKVRDRKEKNKKAGTKNINGNGKRGKKQRNKNKNLKGKKNSGKIEKRGKKDRKNKHKLKIKKKPEKKNNRKIENGRQQNFTSCLEKFIQYSRVNELKATSVSKQVNRAFAFQGLMGKKKGKKGNFQGTYDTLLSALGGNESAPECDGNPINNDTTRQAKYKGTLATLKACEAGVESVCKTEITEADNTTLKNCLAAATTFKAEFKACFTKKTTSEACTCVNNIDTDNFERLTACDTKNKSDEVKARKKKCTKGFQDCKTAQDDSVDGVGTCKKTNRCAGAPNKTQAERVLRILRPLSTALSNPAFENALKSLGLNTGTGSDGKLPGSRLSKTRLARQADGAGCTAILDDWKSFNTSGDKAVPSVNGDVNEAETNKAVTALNKINNRENVTKELGSCPKESSRQAVVILTIVRIRFYVFWCGWFRVTIVEIKITILEISFGLPPSPTPTPAPVPAPTPAPAPTPVATSAPSGGRNIIKQILKRAAFSKSKN